MAGAAEPPVDGMGGGAAGRQHGVDQQGAARRLRLLDVVFLRRLAFEVAEDADERLKSQASSWCLRAATSQTPSGSAPLLQTELPSFRLSLSKPAGGLSERHASTGSA